MPHQLEVEPVDPSWRQEIARRFGRLSTTTARRAPLYAAMSAHFADRPELPDPLQAAPITQRQPVLLLAAIHHLLIADQTDPLVAWFPNLQVDPRPTTDPALHTALADFIGRRSDEITEITARRTTQTNEVGRCSLLLPAMALIAAEVDAPLAHLDVGASGGLHLLLNRVSYRYRPSPGATAEFPETQLGEATALQLTCQITGAMPPPTALPSIATRCGIDRSPIDVTDPAEARWLEACVWPDQRDRFERLVAAIELAHEHPPELVAGDAVASTVPALERMVVRGHPVVTNTWVLNYFTAEARQTYVSELDRFGTDHDLSWVYAESPAQTPDLDHGVPTDQHVTEITLVRWRGGQRRVDHLATCHPHGYWIDWR